MNSSQITPYRSLWISVAFYFIAGAATLAFGCMQWSRLVVDSVDSQVPVASMSTFYIAIGVGTLTALPFFWFAVSLKSRKLRFQSKPKAMGGKHASTTKAADTDSGEIFPDQLSDTVPLSDLPANLVSRKRQNQMSSDRSLVRRNATLTRLFDDVPLSAQGIEILAEIQEGGFQWLRQYSVENGINQPLRPGQSYEHCVWLTLGAANLVVSSIEEFDGQTIFKFLSVTESGVAVVTYGPTAQSFMTTKESAVGSCLVDEVESPMQVLEMHLRHSLSVARVRGSSITELSIDDIADLYQYSEMILDELCDDENGTRSDHPIEVGRFQSPPS